MNWNTNWRGNIDKVLNVDEVLNTDRIFGVNKNLAEDGIGQYEKPDDIGRNFLKGLHIFDLKGEFIVSKPFYPNLVVFIQNFDDTSSIKGDLESIEGFKVNDKTKFIKNLSLKGHFYHVKKMVNFYNNNWNKYQVKNIGATDINNVTNLSFNGKKINKNQLYAECSSPLILKNGIYEPDLSSILSSYNLVESQAPSSVKIHTHPLKGILSYSLNMGKTDIEKNINSTGGPSGEDKNAFGEPRNGQWDVLVDQSKVWFYTESLKFSFDKIDVV